jgi:glycosyltransferase involved in cell wall biosynthesis
LKILLLSFYYPPDLSAGSFRATALVDSLRALAPTGSQVDVITTLPNRYASYAADAQRMEEYPGLRVSRIALPKHNSGMVDQSRAFISFSREAVRLASGRNYDIVVATSGRLMTASLGAWIARRNGAKLYLDIRDIFVHMVRDMLPGGIAWAIAPVFSGMEKWTIARADKVNLVSEGFSEYFKTRYPHQTFSFITNGIDDEFLEIEPARDVALGDASNARPLTVLYAGNIGESQGLHAIVPQLAKSMETRIRFKIIGDGGRKRVLEDALTRSRITNVELVPPMNRADLLTAYRTADVLFLHLNDRDVFARVLPSKIFEYAATGKPVWAGVAGYAGKFVRTKVSNSATFCPCDVDDAVQAFETLRIQDMPRSDFVAAYARTKVARQLAEDIIAVAAPTPGGTRAV